MNRRVVIGIFISILVIVGISFFVKNRIGSVSIPPADDNTSENAEDTITTRLTIPEGYKMEVLADNLAGARDLVIDPDGNLLVSQTSEGKITLVSSTASTVLAENLNKPHGLAFDCHPTKNPPCFLYVAEHSRLGRYVYDTNSQTLSNYEKLVDLESSAGDRHFTRSLLFLASPNENTLLVSVGSSCNVCHEEDEMRSKIMAYDTEAKTFTEYARGLRNAVFMTKSPDGKIFATEMGRDGLGDNTPPDEVNLIEKDNNYGWPNCYGKNIHDTNFDKNTYIRNPCMEPFEKESFVDLQAHSAPLGLAFLGNDLLIAFHGSWNRSEPTGYKIVKINLDNQGNYVNTEDFITGWLTKDGTKLGRPVDILVSPDGAIYISDDSSGTIYKLTQLD